MAKQSVGKKSPSSKARRSFVLSESDVRKAIDKIAEIEGEITELTSDLVAERDKIKADMDQYILDHEDYEDDEYKATRVQGFRRKWNTEKLEKIIPRPIFRKIVKIEVDPAKLDEQVRAGKLDLDKIDAAFEETPNKPYVKVTKKSKSNGATEAASLAEQLK